MNKIDLCIDFGSSRTKFLVQAAGNLHYYTLPVHTSLTQPSELLSRLRMVISLVHAEWNSSQGFFISRVMPITSWPSWIAIDDHCSVMDFFSFDDPRAAKPELLSETLFSCDYRCRAEWLKRRGLIDVIMIPLSNYFHYALMGKLSADLDIWKIGGGPENVGFKLTKAGAKLGEVANFALDSGETIDFSLYSGGGDTILAYSAFGRLDKQIPHLEIGTTPILLAWSAITDNVRVAFSIPNFFKDFFESVAPEALSDSSNLMLALGRKAKNLSLHPHMIKPASAPTLDNLVNLGKMRTEFLPELRLLPMHQRLQHSIQYIVSRLKNETQLSGPLTVGGAIGASNLCIDVLNNEGFDVVEAIADATLQGAANLLNNESRI